MSILIIARESSEFVMMFTVQGVGIYIAEGRFPRWYGQLNIILVLFHQPQATHVPKVGLVGR